MTCLVGTDVERAAALIRDGGVVAFATETVYGLGANAFDVRAVARVFEVKGRPRFDPLIVHIADAAELPRLTTDVPERAIRLADRFWPGPLTLVLHKSQEVPDLVTAGLPTVAVRVPDHPLARRLIERAGVPIAAPSANPFGRISPTTADHVREQLGTAIDYILDGGPCRVGVESTVLALTGGQPTLLRPGGVTAEEIEAVVGPVASVSLDDAADSQPQASPGLMSRHYAPLTPLQIVSDAAEVSPGPHTGLLTLRPISQPERFAAVEVLSEAEDLREAASHFFAALRRLDARRLTRIVAVAFPDEDLGRALNDRLRRAASHPARTASEPSEI